MAVARERLATVTTVTTRLEVRGDALIIRAWAKDLVRLALLGAVVVFRVSGVYWPLWLALERQPRSTRMADAVGVVLHTRERRSLVVLALLSLETLASGEDIAAFCVQLARSEMTWPVRALKLLSIARVVWPVAWLLRLLVHAQRWLSRDRVRTAAVDDLVLLACPLVWLLLPALVARRGLELELFGGVPQQCIGRAPRRPQRPQQSTPHERVARRALRRALWALHSRHSRRALGVWDADGVSSLDHESAKAQVHEQGAQADGGGREDCKALDWRGGEDEEGDDDINAGGRAEAERTRALERGRRAAQGAPASSQR
ncbi:hypothetical protein PINS_up013095 [Pythium insidiosum]|nr:hypothetical protein PINS_up013095 [Pythium insidiosum]